MAKKISTRIFRIGNTIKKLEVLDTIPLTKKQKEDSKKLTHQIRKARGGANLTARNIFLPKGIISR